MFIMTGPSCWQSPTRTTFAAEDEQDEKGIDLFKLQPKKPNWDLKRDLEKKLEILNVRTDNAVARLVRERIGNAQKASGATSKQLPSSIDGEAVGMDGVALVEGVRVREREEEEEELWLQKSVVAFSQFRKV